MTTQKRYYVYLGPLRYGTYVDAISPSDSVKRKLKHYKLLEVKNKNVSNVQVKLVVGQRTSEKYYYVKPDYSKFSRDFQSNLLSMKTLLERHSLYFEEAELLQSVGTKEPLEFTKKAYGDSHSYPVEDEFGKDYPILVRLAKYLKLELPDDIWYD